MIPCQRKQEKLLEENEMKTGITRIGLVFLSVWIIFFTTDGWTAAKFLTIGSSMPSSSHYPYFVSVAKVINEFVPGLNATVVTAGGGVENLKKMEKGQADMGLVTIDSLYMAYNGIGAWKDNPQKKQRVMWLYATTAVHFVVREDSGVKTIYDLHRKKFNPSMRGSATEASTIAIFKILGIEPEYHKGDAADAVAAVKDNRIVGMCKSGLGKQLDASTMDVATFTPIRVLEFTEKDIKKVNAEMPWIAWTTVPAGAVKGKKEEYKTLAMVNFVTGVEDISEDFGFKIVKAICEHMDIQEAAFPALKGLNFPKATLETLIPVSPALPLHLGSVKYFRELGLQVPSQLVPQK